MDSGMLYHCVLYTLTLAVLVSNCMKLAFTSLFFNNCLFSTWSRWLDRALFLWMGAFCLYLLWIPIKWGKMLWKVWTVAEGTQFVGSVYQCTSLLSYHMLAKEKQHNLQKPCLCVCVCVGYKRQQLSRRNWSRAVTAEQLSLDSFLKFQNMQSYWLSFHLPFWWNII